MFSLLCLLAISGGPAFADTDAPAPASPEQGRQAVVRGLEFLQQDAVKWRKERECSTCHHGTMTVWALSEAKSQGYPVTPETFTETVTWTKERLLERIDLPRDTRPGWSMLNSSAMYLSVMAQCVPDQEAVSADELQRIGAHLLRHQESDGSWAWSSAPAKNRPPPFFESDEVATRLAYTALRPQVPADPAEKSAVRDSREKGSQWLVKTEPTDTTQAVAFQLLVQALSGESAEQKQPGIDNLLKRQHPDGGWGQLAEAPSDAYATGQTLYVLNLAGLSRDRAEVQKGVAFLVRTQKEDGSWPMIRRSHPGVTPSDFVVPITYFGSAWGTLGLMRSVARP